MPKRHDYDPQFPDREGGSLLKPVLASTPLAASLAYTANIVGRDGTIKQPREAGIDQAIDRLMARPYKGPPIPTQEAVQRFMQGQSADINRQAWKWAMESIDPFTRSKLRNFADDISGMTAIELESAVSMSVSENTSGTMGKIYQRFKRNVEMLQAQEALSEGKLPVFTPVEDLTAFATKTYGVGRKLPLKMEAQVAEIAEALGGTFKAYGISSAAAQAEGLGIWNVTFGSEIGEFKVELPQIKGGIMLQGSDLQTRRIAPDILHVGTKGELTRMDRTQFFLKELKESIVPDIGTRLKTQRDVEMAVKQLKQKMFGELEAVPNVAIEGRTAAQARREAMRGMSVDVVVQEEVRKKGLEYKQGYRRPKDREISKLLTSEQGKKLGLRGGVAPDAMVKGRLSTVDWERLYMGEVDYSRRPEQPYREWQATRGTLETLGQRTTASKFRASEMAGELAYQKVTAPNLRTMYVDPSMYRETLEKLAMGEGEALARASAAESLLFERSTSVKLSQVRGDIADFANIQAGEIIGTKAGGEPWKLPLGTQITGVQRMSEDVVQLDLLETRRLRHGDKIFGGAKAVALTRDSQEFAAAVKAFNSQQEVDLIVNMDELRKNKSLHRRQISSSLLGMQGAHLTKEWSKRSSSHEDFVRQAMRHAIQDIDVTPQKFGEAFGAVPYVLGDTQAAARLVREAAEDTVSEKTIRKLIGKMAMGGTAGGMAEITYGGQRYEAGVMGSLESRAMDILSGEAYGGTGRQISKEFAERLRAANPDAFIAHTEISKTLAGLVGKEVPSDLPEYRPGTSFQNFVQGGGGVIRPGYGMNEIYVPSAETMKAMRPFETPTGVQVRGNVADIYADIAYKANLLAEEAITPEQFQKDIDFSADLLRKEWAPAGKGAGTLTKGKFIGSRFLRGVSAMGGGAETAIREANVAGITKGAFEEMYNELMESGLYDDQAEAMKKMRAQFLAGEDVSAMLTRHPFIGEFSLQPTKVRMVKGSDDLIVLPEMTRRIKGEIGGETFEKSIRLGPLIGFAGDKDADAYSVALLSPRTEDAVRRNLLSADNEFAQRYSQHQVRMELFKAGKARAGDAGEITIRQLMAANVEKLSSGQRWIAPLSLQMTETKRALTKFGQGSAAADARFLLEWLEQTPISAKHMTAMEAGGGGLESLMTSITDAMATRNATRLEGNIATIVKNDQVSNSLLTQSAFMDKESAEKVSA